MDKIRVEWMLQKNSIVLFFDTLDKCPQYFEPSVLSCGLMGVPLIILIELFAWCYGGAAKKNSVLLVILSD